MPRSPKKTFLSFLILFFAMVTVLVPPSVIYAATFAGSSTVTQTSSIENCRMEGRTIVFFGDSGAELSLCLLKRRTSNPRILKITSPGGQASASMMSAYTIRAMGLSIVVDRYCNSSCANYLLPAAKSITVPEGSYVMVHGSVGPPEEMRAKIIETMMRESRLTRTEAEAQIGPSMRESTIAYEMQQNFKRDFNIRDNFYAQPTFREFPVGSVIVLRENGERTNMLVSATAVRACLPRVKVNSFWFPSSNEQKLEIVNRFSRSTIAFPVVNDPFGC